MSLCLSVLKAERGIEMEAYVNEEYLKGLYAGAEKRFSALAVSSSDRYSVLRQTVIKRFLKYGMEDIDCGQYERAVYVYRCLLNIMDNLEKQDNPSWEETPEANGAAPEGFSMINKEGRPVFYCGYGHFEQVKKDIAEMKSFGCNTIQIEVGPSYVLFEKGTHEKCGMARDRAFADGERYIYSAGDFEVNLSYVKKNIIPVLETAEKEDVAVCLLLSPHYAPNWIFEKYPDMRSKNVGFIKYNIYHPKAKEMIEAFLNAVVPLVKDYKSLQSICISNEPAFNTMADCSDNEVITHDLLPTEEQEIKGRNMLYEWQKYLRSRYNGIVELNSLLGSDYSDFSEVGMPDDADDTPQFYQWYQWNNRQFAEWHKWMADIVKSLAPDIPVHAKLMPVFGSSDSAYHRRFLKYGTDPEMFAEFTDMSGNDAWSFEGRAHLPLSYKLAWYDYLSSLKRMPIDNSEDHVIEDRDNNYSEIQAKRIYADMWQGAVHGRTLTQIWVWERSNVPHATANGSILHRPDCVEAVGRACLDLNRLAFEAAAVQNCSRSCAILYSKPSRVFNREYSAQMFKAYEGALYAGFRPYFITEDKIDALMDFEMLIVAGTTNIYQKTADKIAEFIKKGKYVFIVGKMAEQDEYNRPLDARDYTGAIYISPPESGNCPDAEFSQKITDCVLKYANHDIYIEEENGVSYNIEWCKAEYDGRTLINLCSYDSAVRKVRIKSRKQDIKEVRDLISGCELTGMIEAQPYTPMLLEIL